MPIITRAGDHLLTVKEEVHPLKLNIGPNHILTRHDPKHQAFYTTPEGSTSAADGVKDHVITTDGLSIEEGNYVVVDPAAGDGALTKGHFDDALLFDINPPPDRPDIKQQDFFTLTDLPVGDKVIIFHVNPPFNKFIEFFDHMANFNPGIISVIAPDRFRADCNMRPGWVCVAHKPMKPSWFTNEIKREQGKVGKVNVKITHQIWVPCDITDPRQPSTTNWLVRVNDEITVDEAHEVFYVTHANPKSYERQFGRKVITRSKRPEGCRQTRVSFDLPGATGAQKKKFLRHAVVKMWKDHPAFTDMTLHELNLKLAIHEHDCCPI